MATAKQTDAAPPLEGRADPVPDIADDLADMLRRGRVAGPTAAVSVEWRLADGRKVYMDLPAPVKPAVEMIDESRAGLSETARDILEVLEDRNGEWVHGADVAMDLPGQPEHKSTAFTAPIAELKRADLIETSQRHGYRVKRKDS